MDRMAKDVIWVKLTSYRNIGRGRSMQIDPEFGSRATSIKARTRQPAERSPNVAAAAQAARSARWIGPSTRIGFNSQSSWGHHVAEFNPAVARDGRGARVHYDVCPRLPNGSSGYPHDVHSPLGITDRSSCSERIVETLHFASVGEHGSTSPVFGWSSTCRMFIR